MRMMEEVKLTSFALVRPIKNGHPVINYGDNISPTANHQRSNISVMQTLDRKISASSDQLDNLRRKKRCEQPQRAQSGSRITYSEGSTYRERDKTPFELFLEDDGPYSRKLYGRDDRSRSRERQRSRDSRERQVYRQEYENREQQAAMTGLLWIQKNRIFSR